MEVEIRIMEISTDDDFSNAGLADFYKRRKRTGEKRLQKSSLEKYFASELW